MFRTDNFADFLQSDFYKVLQPMSKGHVIQGLFNTQDDKLHRAMKIPIAGIYSMSNLIEFEPYVDSTIAFFFKRLEEVQSKSRQSCDLGTWLQWFAFDVMGEITFSRRLGFLEEAKDVDGIMASIWKLFQYSSWVKLIDLLESWQTANHIRLAKCPGLIKYGPKTHFSAECCQQRLRQL